MPSVDDRSLVAGFLHELAVRTARRVKRLPWGVAVFNDELRRVWDLNVLWIADVPESLTPGVLDTEKRSGFRAMRAWPTGTRS